MQRQMQMTEEMREEKAHSETHPESEEQPCPYCFASLPVVKGYVTWCEHCGWNLVPQIPLERKSSFGYLFDSMYDRVGVRSSRKLYEQMVKNASAKPPVQLTVWLALVISCCVHALTAAVALLGVFLIYALWPHWSGGVLGLICFGIAWVLRPKVEQKPKDLLSREEYPTLYKLVDEISTEMGTSTVDGIEVTPRFNAGIHQYGWRRKKILSIGLPLFLILSGQEKAALIGYEVAHGANGNPNRGFIVRHAIRALNNWYYLLYPEVIFDSEQGIRGLMMIVPNLLMRGFCKLIWLLNYVLVHLLWKSSQWAVYGADSLAAEVVGTDAMMAMLEKLHFREMFRFLVQKVYLNKGKMRFTHVFPEAIAQMPERELQRIRRVEMMEQSRLDTTHPPTPYRVAYMWERNVEVPRYLLSSVDRDQLEKELSSLYAGLDERLMKWYVEQRY